MSNPFSRTMRELLQCPYCPQLHPEDQGACPASGEVILLDGKYRLKTLIGEGSFGLVWDARNIDTQKEVAIKSLRAEVVSNGAVLDRFFWEATAAGRIHDPHVCDVLDLVKSSVHGPYIVLERLSGRSLEAMIQEQGQLAPEMAVLLLRQALIGLEAVHRAGIVHRDIKPENIFLHEPGEGRVQVKLLDFGISKFTVASGHQARTAADMFMGTPEYTSPEQARGAAQVDLRTDIWAIGAILYRALAGVPPYTGPDVPSLLTAILHARHTPLIEAAPQVPAGLAAIVDRCLSKDRDQRFAACSELSAALEPFESLQFARTVLGARSPVVAPRSDPRARTRAYDDASAPSSPSSASPVASASPVSLPAEPQRAVDGSEPVILCCTAADRRWLDHLRQHLKTHRDGSRLTILDSAEFGAGATQREAIEAAFIRARAVILLVSPHFMAEDFAPGGQLFSLVFMAQGRGLPVMWMMISESAYEGTDLLDFQILGDPSRPLDRLPFTEADRVLEEICDQLVLPLGGATPAPVPGVTRLGIVAAGSARADGTRDLEHRLEMARARKARLDALGEDSTSVRDEINMLRRSLRMGRPLQPGDVLDDRFVVREQLGAGGFATVWHALDQRSGAPVALKVLHAQHVHNADRRERFFRGARIMAQLDHPNIVKIIEPWASDGEYEYFVMQYVAGGTLRDAVIGGRLSVTQRLQALLAIAEALGFAHERGIIHRDVKPSNILVGEDGTPLLTDFDLVRTEDTTGGTAGGLGTVIYAAPEMMERASEADARADVYGLGMTLAFLFYERDLTMEVIRSTDRLINELKIPESIRMVIRTAITWNRDHRFRTAGEFHSALTAAIVRRNSLPPMTMITHSAQAGVHAGTVIATASSAPAPSVAPVASAEASTPRLSGGHDESISSLSLVRAFEAIAKESDAAGDHAVSEVFASLEVHEEPHAGAEASHRSQRSAVPLPADDSTLPDRHRGASTTNVVMIGLGAGVLATLVYLLLA